MTAKRFYMDKSGDLYDKENGLLMLDFGYSYDGVNCKKIIDVLNEFQEEIEYLKPLSNENTHYIADMEDDIILFKQTIEKLEKENRELKQEIKDLRIGVLDSIHEADEIKCSCNPCVVEECVKKVIR